MNFSSDPINTLENLTHKNKTKSISIYLGIKKIEKNGGTYFRAMKLHGTLIHLSHTNEVLEKPILY